MAISGFFKRSKCKDQAHSLYLAVVAQVRKPVFYRRCNVPDTLDGRFELIVLHTALLLRRLRDEGEAGAELGQTLFDVMLDDMDQSLREMGVGDLGVGRRVKAMAKAFYGRSAVYEAGLSAGDELNAALDRNLYGTVDVDATGIAIIADYMRSVSNRLADISGIALLAGTVDFGDAPEDDHGDSDVR